MYYSGPTPPGASEFEAAFGLAPLGEEVTAARLARLEAIVRLFISAAVASDSERARVWIGGFAPSKYEIPVPSEAAVSAVLDQFRAPEEATARREAHSPDFND